LLEQKVPWSVPDISKDEEVEVSSVMASKWLGMGPKTRELEENICNYIRVKNATVVNNGTSALIAALIANDINSGDKVLVPTYTFIATVNSVLAIGAQPVLIDCDPHTFNISISNLETTFEQNKDAKCLLFVDVAGLPADIDPIREFSRRHSISLIEDAAEAFGAKYKDKLLGAYDHTTIFSFHIAKQMTMVEGGAIVTEDEKVAGRLKLIRSHGEGKEKYVHTDFGLNFRPTDLQSSIGIAQLKKVDGYMELRGQIAELYISHLSEHLEFQQVPSYVSKHPWMLFMCLAKDRVDRDNLNKFLNERGVDTRIPWPPANIQPYHRSKLGNISCPNAEKVYERVLSLPIGNAITKGEAERVIDVVKDFYASKH
jgi:perosamine synthetase